ncbi:MAG TPA: GDP-mannose 4,6-dehydratase [Methanospirillum sp.]|uniref:GDP-mannose 4,6-dehydratase n=1 Tax=Methanospirillum sp. TaxID=45200 RepID=UPI002CCBAC58|nr:GDP-mannose 4,6-dehydratase [Methanospirillum sp.]HPY61435.1 GDP-mannose 4,6-dehydratase [Methanospirillum sp.]
MSKTVCVIGSNSFSGSDFIDHVLEVTDYDIIGISRSPEKDPIFLPYKMRSDLSRFSFYQLDLNTDMPGIKSLFSEKKPEFIVNFAAQSEVAPSWDHPEQWFMTNAVAIAKLGNYLKDQKWLSRYVQISTPEIYGTCEGFVDEHAPINPSTPYAASKSAGDLMLQTLVKNFNFPLITIRSTNVYGAHQQLHKIIPRSIIYLKTGKKIPLHGGGNAVKSYIHIRDISKGELLAMERGVPGEIYHLSPDEGISIKDLVSKICMLMGKDFESSVLPVGERLGQDKAYTLDSSKARDNLGWKPVISLDEGLAEVIGWVENNIERITVFPLEYAHQE